MDLAEGMELAAMTANLQMFRSVCALAVVLLLSACGGTPTQQAAREASPEVEVDVFIVPPAPAPEAALSVPSTLTVEHEADLLAEEPGRLAEVLVDQGAAVKKGQLLARLDSERLRKQLDQDRAELEHLEAELKQDEVLVKAAEVELQRQTELRNEGLGSMRDFDRARFNLESVRHEVMKGQSKRDVARAKVEEGEIRVARLSIRAPFDGVVARRYAREGQLLLQDEKVMRVTELRPLLVRFTVPEAYRTAARTGTAVAVHPLDGSVRAAAARIVRTGYVVDAASGAVECIARMDDPVPAELVPGMAVEVRFPELPRRAPPVAVIPPSALRRSSDDRGEVFVITGNRLQRRQVQLGRDTPAGVEVRSGISAGERLVRHAAPQLQDGMSVRIRP